MSAVLRSKASYSATALASILIGLVAAKAWALLLGPRGLGWMALMQGLVSVVTLVGGMGVGVAFVRAGAAARATSEVAKLASLRRGAAILIGSLAVISAVAVQAMAEPISRAVFANQVPIESIRILALAVLFGVLLSFPAALLNAYERVRALTLAGIFNVALSTIALLMTVWLARERGIAPGMALGAGLAFVVTLILVREVPVVPALEFRSAWNSARQLLTFGAPYMLATLAAAAVSLALPILILHRSGPADVGLYRASSVVSAYLGMFLSAIAFEYYPRISAAADGEVQQVVRQEQRLIVSVAFPAIFLIFTLGKYLLPLIYSPSFTPAAPLLEWQMIGDLVRFWTWAFSYALLARWGSGGYFLAESAGAVTTVAVTTVMLDALGVTAAGVGYLIGQIISSAIVLLLARRTMRLLPDRWSLLSLAAAVGMGVAIQGIPFLRGTEFRILFALASLLWMAWTSVRLLRQLVTSP